MITVMRRLLITCSVMVLTGCGDSTGTNAEVSGGLHPVISGYVDDWIDLNEHFGREIASTSLGEETALQLRQDASGHHEVRCIEVKQYAYVGISFDGPNIFLEAIDCQPRLFFLRPNLGARFNFSAAFRAMDPPRTVAGLSGDPNKVTIFRVYFDLLPRMALLQSGDFEIECLQAGKTVIHVSFESNPIAGSEAYTLVCGHEQGGGS